ncbi:Intraflagellar transport protein 140 homolog-like Protein [Tribolium castaneum]|uniref:Intraflagellar transport protein 140 homolog-like Protein n=1 Tax=Tribolium castaneum TaxID=7070 RepID=D6WYI0_TRICA|nr:PREDICTED: intraflagellar transport protein 140 homolog [Tribolium castaneum]EFA08985.1 Intraflagellar transport protein 140 homolog-like Protein [Tribolium castaneum]|eukprot:XP_973773.2 PREDICTED: intraflagellar transport protein 140 homolog [Tribolium castaneum]
MTLYFENPVSFPEPGSISLNGVWHPNSALLAVASFSQDKGGYVTIFDELGEPLSDINYPVHRSFQVTALAWHPERHVLATGWENGEFKIWNGEKDFALIGGPHKAPITLLEFSEKGGRLVSCDSAGSLVGWKVVDSQAQTVMVFHLDLKESITHLTFRITIKPHPDFDVEGLAKAAVNGDERALDLFSNWRPKTTARKFRVQEGSDNLSFYVGTQVGSIYYVNSGGSCMEVLNTEGVPLSYIVHHPSKDALIVMMEGLTIGHFSVDSQGQLNELAKVKLSGRVQSRGVGTQGLVWCSNSSLAVLTGDLIVRIWDIETNDNYVLPTSLKFYTNDDKNRTVSEVFTCLAFCKLNQTLCAGTNIGRIYFWTRNTNNGESPEDCWELNNVNTVSGTVKQLMWGSVQLRLPLLSVNCVTCVYIMKEQSICTCFSDEVWCTQKTASQVLVESAKSNVLLTLETQITDMCINDSFAIFTNGRRVLVYEIFWDGSDSEKFELNTNISKQTESSADFSIKLISTFACDNEKVLLHKKMIVVLTAKAVTLRQLNGSVITTIVSPSHEGEPIGLDVTGNYLTIFTIEGYMKVYELGENEAKLSIPARNLYDMCPDFGEIIQAKSNSSGNKIALTLAAANLVPDGRLYVWDVENDNLLSYDFHKYGNFDLEPSPDEFSVDERSEQNDSSNDDETVAVFDEICSNRIPLHLFWDAHDPRLLICDAKKVKLGLGEKKLKRSRSDTKTTLKDQDHIIITMFVSSEHGIKMHDIRGVEAESRLLALATPYLVILEKLVIVRDVMSDFNGLESCNKETRDAVLNFSYNLSLGNMDEAFKAIKLVQNPGVWGSLARMCVKTRRLDVAGVCLGHMGNARAAMALRVAVADYSLPHEAKLAVLAVHLGMLDEAEQLYIQCQRYDLLNKLLRSRNKFDAAHAIAESQDRIHLKNTDHAWGKALEAVGDFKEAAVRYEKANTHKFDVPRMLLDQPQQLETYMGKTKDPDLLKWWGQYVESQGEMQAALKIYSSAGDVYSQVRVLCFLGEESKAAELARSGRDKAAFYHMARFYETTGNFEEAVNFFTKANAYSNAVRLCKENHMSDELWNIGSVAGTREKLECARYFEEIGALDKSVILYHRAGMLHKALDLAFKAQQYDILQQIATDLDADSDPALVQKCADYFVTNEQFDKAVDLLAIAKKYKEAITICLTHNVQLTEDLAEKLTPEKDQLEEADRVNVLQTLAESLMLQGNYHLATKKFTQAGDKIRAMKALLKSGDTDKIIFFAGVSRQREIYIMAANYLQSLDWQNNPEILRNIITFYSKGKALDLLANFYVACAQVEIDEFKNYEKAFGALTEASRCLAKIGNPRDSSQHQRATEIVQQRLTMIKRFVDIRRLFDRGDYQAGIAQCRQLLMTGGKELEESVRRGDICALMIQEYIKSGNFTEAKQLLGELKQLLFSSGNTPITYYLNKETIEALAHGLGVPVSTLIPAKMTLEDEDTEEFVEEAIED